MTISFRSASELKKIVDLLAIQEVTESLSAGTCIRVFQRNFNTSELTTLEPQRGRFTRVFSHGTYGGGTEELSYLIYYADLKEKLGKMAEASSNSSVTLRTTSGRLNLISDLFNTGEKSREKGRLVLRTYPGDQQDFSPVVDIDNKLASFSGEEFDKLLQMAIKFGDYTEKRERNSVTRSCLFRLNKQEQTLSLLENCRKFSGAFIKLSIPAEGILENREFSIEGRFLKKLIGLGKSYTEEEWEFNQITCVDLHLGCFEDQEWVSFKGEGGNSSVRTVDSELEILNYSNLFQEETTPTGVKINSNRRLLLSNLVSAIKMQKPAESEPSQALIIMEEDSQFRIYKAADLSEFEVSYTDLSYVDPDLIWDTISINCSGLLISLECLQIAIRGTQLELIELQEKVLVQKSGRKCYLLMLKPIQSTIDISIVISCKPAEEEIISLDE